MTKFLTENVERMIVTVWYVPQAGEYGDMSAEYVPADEGHHGGRADSARGPHVASTSSARRVPRPVLQPDERDSPLRAPPAPARLAPLLTTPKKLRQKIVQEARSCSDRLRIWLQCLLACVSVLYFIF